MPAELIERIAALEAQLAEAQADLKIADGLKEIAMKASRKAVSERDKMWTDLEHWRHEVGKLHSQRDRIKAEARNAALDEAIEAITFEAEGRKAQMDAHEHDAVQHERFRIGELQSRLNVKNVAALKTVPTP